MSEFAPFNILFQLFCTACRVNSNSDELLNFYEINFLYFRFGATTFSTNKISNVWNSALKKIRYIFNSHKLNAVKNFIPAYLIDIIWVQHHRLHNAQNYESSNHPNHWAQEVKRSSLWFNSHKTLLNNFAQFEFHVRISFSLSPSSIILIAPNVKDKSLRLSSIVLWKYTCDLRFHYVSNKSCNQRIIFNITSTKAEKYERWFSSVIRWWWHK